MKKHFLTRLLCAALSLLLCLSAAALAESGGVADVHLVRRVGDFAPEIERIVYTLDGLDVSALTAEDFTVTTTNSFGETVSAQPEEIQVSENTLTLVMGADNHLEVKIDSRDDNRPEDTDLTVTCSNEALNINYANISGYETLVADTFENMTVTTEDGRTLSYAIFDPEASEAVPLVLFLHGGGKNDIQLWDTPLPTSFAEEEWQSENPCYVLAPSSTGFSGWEDAACTALKSVIDELIAAGKVDASRLYICGHSMGSLGTYNFVELYPDYFAVAMPIDGGAAEYGYDWRAMTSGRTAFYLLQCTDDPTAGAYKARMNYAFLCVASGFDYDRIQYKEYSALEIQAMNLSKDFEAIEIPGFGKPLYHGGDIVFAADRGMQRTMFSYVLPEAEAAEEQQ